MTTCLGNMVYCFDVDGWMDEQLIDRQTYSSRRQIKEGGANNLIFPLKSICNIEQNTLKRCGWLHGQKQGKIIKEDISED